MEELELMLKLEGRNIHDEIELLINDEEYFKETKIFKSAILRNDSKKDLNY